MSVARRRLADALGLLLISAVLLDLLQPSLLLLPTIAAGGDTPCHYPTAVWFRDHLLPQLRLHGWYPGTYLGQPLLLYYFPLPFVVMAVLSPVVGMPVAFKLATALGVLALPLAAYVALRRMRLPFPAPLVGAGAGLAFLYVEDNPIWGGTLVSTLTGEFSYAYGIALAVLFLGEVFRARVDRRGPWLPALVLGLTAYAHGYAVLWAGLTASAFLLWERQAVRTLVWLAALAALAFALAAPLLLPLLSAWGWTTPYDDAWIEMSARGLVPSLLWPLFGCAIAGLLALLVSRLRGGTVDRRLLLFAWGAVVGAALTTAGPGLGVIDVRFVPFAQLSLAICGASALGLLLARIACADLAALGLILLTSVQGDSASRIARSWIDWNYSGLEAKQLWPAWLELCERIKGGASDPRVSVEYDPLHELAGSIRMYEGLFHHSGRATLEGVYNQASTSTHPVYYLASELFWRSPNPFRSRTYSRFDPQHALERLRLFNVGTIVATSPQLRAALDARADVVREAQIAPYTVYRLRDPGPGYVEALAFEPTRVSPRDWRDQSYRWFTRKPANRALLVFTDDARFAPAPAGSWGPPPERPLLERPVVRSRIEAETIEIDTDRPGHPLLVKVSYHPRWRAEGAAGPYLVSPGLMLVVPTARHVRLRYAARTGADWSGYLLAAGALALMGAACLRRGPASEGPEDGFRVRRLVQWVPVVVLLALASLRLAPARTYAREVRWLYARASQAYAAEQWEDAAEFARHAADLAGVGEFAPRRSDPDRIEMLCLRGEALLRAGHAREAAEAFGSVVEHGPSAHLAQALFSGAQAREAAGDPGGAEAWRRDLRINHAQTPWAERLSRVPASALDK